MSPVIDKQQFENQSGGWVGAVVIGPKGDETGVAVEPGQTVWLSEAEQILTANAPRLPEDNPFLPKTVKRIDDQTGEWVEHTVTPLVPVDRDRFVPANSRPIPADLATGAQATGAAQVAATGEQPETFVAGDPVAEREEAVKAAATAPPVPPKAAAAAEAPAAPPAPSPEPSASPDQTAAEADEQAGDDSERTEVQAEEQPRPPAQQPAPFTPQQNIQ